MRRGLSGRDRQTLVFRPFYLGREFLRPSIPDMVGTRAFRTRSSWEFNPALCPCDAHLTEYLEERQQTGIRLFHFGTGSHHMVGLWCHRTGKGDALGITASVKEHGAYARMVLSDPDLARRYKVLFCDIYLLGRELLPTFDVVTLFHLGEFTPSQGEGAHPDGALLDLFLSRLASGGRMIFYKGSFGWGKSEHLVDALIAEGRLRFEEDYRSLRIYAKAD